MSESGIKIAEPWIKALFGVSANSVSIYEALKAGAPGATSVTPPAPDTAEAEEVDPDLYRYPIFPDGNASVARLLVSHLVPSAVSGDAAESIVTRVVDYGRLDREGASVRLRLNSTAVNVTNRDDGLVDVAYVIDGKNRVVRCRSSILAGLRRHGAKSLPRTSGRAAAKLSLWRKSPVYLHQCSFALWGRGAKTSRIGLSVPRIVLQPRGLGATAESRGLRGSDRRG